MPDRELRRMSRTELVEIIFALKQSEDQLKAENDALKAQLADRQIRIENAGSIAQAALELNRVFEAAQAAADEYLASVRTSSPKPDAISDALREQARADAEAEVREMMSEAERQAAQATYHALEEASVQWEHKKEEARQRIPQAARWIVEKVVER